MENVQINLTADRFRVLRDLIDRGMEEKLSKFDGLETDAETDRMIADTLDAVAFFCSHGVTHHVD